MPYVSRLHTSPPAILTPSVSKSLNASLPVTSYTRHYNASLIIPNKKQKYAAVDKVAYNDPSVAYNILPENILTRSGQKHIDTSGFEQKNRQHGYEEPMSLLMEEGNKSDHKRINISVAGGPNYGTINTGYAIGAAVDKKLTNKFGLEVAVAYVGNTASTSGTQSLPPFRPRGYFPSTTSPVVTSPLNYLQFAPLANYSLFPKFTLSAGVDLQRLLQVHGVTVLYNDNTRVVPTMDLGMLLRTEYSMSPHIKAGLSYRFGANNLVSPGNNYLDRNYMQIQLKYKLH